MEISYFDSVQRANREYTRFLEPVCKQYNLTKSEVDVLLFLYNNPGSDRATDIVSGRGMAKSHVSLSVGTLEEKGLLIRRNSPTDRRAVHLALTDAGLLIAEQARGAQQQFFRAIYSGITKEELAIWRKIAKKIEYNIKNMESK